VRVRVFDGTADAVMIPVEVAVLVDVTVGVRTNVLVWLGVVVAVDAGV
jgi:hypothetical protein